MTDAPERGRTLSVITGDLEAIDVVVVTRQDRDNKPVGGWYPAQAMTREEALRAATMDGAYAMFAEDILGSIEIGKLADFVVIPVDHMTIPAEDIWKIEPDMTVIGGEVVYTKPVQGGEIDCPRVTCSACGVPRGSLYSSENRWPRMTGAVRTQICYSSDAGCILAVGHSVSVLELVR